MHEHASVQQIVRGYLKGIVASIIAFGTLGVAILAYQAQVSADHRAALRETIQAAVQPVADRVSRVESQVGQLDTLRVDVAVLRDEMTRSVVPAAKVVRQQLAPQATRTANRVRRIEAQTRRRK